MTHVPAIEAELLAHLDTQIASARRLLQMVLSQGTAIRERDVEAVVARLGDIQTEMGRRGALEQARMRLLVTAGQALRMPPAQVTLDAPNVDMAEAMVAVIESQRAFELSSKAITTADQMMGTANEVKR